MTPDPADLGRVLFADHGHTCCECCDGYCPQDDAGPGLTWGTPVAVTIHGVYYEGLTIALVRADVAKLPVGATPAIGTITPKAEATFVVPAARPPASAKPMQPELLHRIDRAGLTSHDDGGPHLHLYRGDEHVGWTMPLAGAETIPYPGIHLADLPLIRRVAGATSCGMNEAAVAVRTVLDALGVSE